MRLNVSMARARERKEVYQLPHAMKTRSRCFPSTVRGCAVCVRWAEEEDCRELPSFWGIGIWEDGGGGNGAYLMVDEFGFWAEDPGERGR